MVFANAKKYLNLIFKNPAGQVLFLIYPAFIFIFVNVLCENFIGVIYHKQTQRIDLLLLSIFCVLQIIFAPIQSSFSDVYGRKKGLMFALFMSLVSLIFLYLFNIQANSAFTFLILATIIKAVLGNTLPIALAVIADAHYKNYRLLFAFATAAYALAYLVLAYAVNPIGEFEHLTGNILDVKINIYLMLFVVLVMFFCLFLRRFKKEEGRYKILQTFNAEINLIKKDINCTDTRKALSAFFLWEISLYIILLTHVNFQMNKTDRIAEFMMFGYLIGVFILFFSHRLKDSKVIQIGYWLSFLSLVPYFILFKVLEDQTWLLRLCCAFHALGNSFLSPSFLSILAKRLKPHEQGRMYGLTDSVDTLAYWFGILIIIFLIKVLKLDIIYLLIFSFIVFAYSWKYYRRFQKIND